MEPNMCWEIIVVERQREIEQHTKRLRLFTPTYQQRRGTVQSAIARLGSNLVALGLWLEQIERRELQYP